MLSAKRIRKYLNPGLRILDKFRIVKSAGSGFKTSFRLLLELILKQFPASVSGHRR